MNSETSEPTDQQALSLIELITGDDFCEDLDMRAFSKGGESQLTGDLRIAHEKLSRIYMIAHSMVRDSVCHHVHDNWRAEIVPQLDEILSAGRSG